MRLFCSILFLTAAATSVLYAGDLSTRPKQITSVVKADPRTGKLVRSVVVTPKPVVGRTVAETVVSPRLITPAPPAAEKPAPPKGIHEAVEQIAAQHSIEPELIHSVIKVESNYNPYAVSSKGALGLMQLIPSTARRFGVSDVFNPVENIEGGARYLKYLLDLYHDNWALALAAYNAGENAVAKYGTVPPYPETQNYLQMVAAQLRKARAETAKREKEAKPVETTPERPRHIQEVVETDGTVRYVAR